MYKEGSQCPACGQEGLQKKVITEKFEYKGETFSYPNYVIYECPSCGDAVVDKKSLKESGRVIRDFYRQVDGLLVSSEIKRIRKFKLCLTQDRASELLGGGAKSFARYENNEVIQSKALDNLLRILDDNPSMLMVIAGKSEEQKDSIVMQLSVKYNSKRPVEMRTRQDEEYYNTDMAVCNG
jgi:HTH-type transcriptional regulator / antitoxin MqsA